MYRYRLWDYSDVWVVLLPFQDDEMIALILISIWFLVGCGVNLFCTHPKATVTPVSFAYTAAFWPVLLVTYFMFRR